MSYLMGESMTGGYGSADILHDCTIAVEQGEIAVVVGPNGAGKSTAMKAVFGMLSLRKGQVTLDGEDITSLSPQDRVYKGMGMVPQTNNVFTSMSVQENLEMGAFLRRDDINTTMEQVFELFPILKEKRRQNAGELSGGQRQRLAIARAILKDPKILLLDEATSALDAESEHRVQVALENLMRGRTTVIIAHRLATIRNADSIAVLEDGRLLAQGKHDELLKTSPLYKRLSDLQFQEKTANTQA